MGRGTNPPPQFGQTFPSTPSTQGAQNVHSNEQMRASVESGGNGSLQCSQVGRSSSMGRLTLSFDAQVVDDDAAQGRGGRAGASQTGVDDGELDLRAGARG